MLCTEWWRNTRYMTWLDKLNGMYNNPVQKWIEYNQVSCNFKLFLHYCQKKQPRNSLWSLNDRIWELIYVWKQYSLHCSLTSHCAISSQSSWFYHGTRSRHQQPWGEHRLENTKNRIKCLSSPEQARQGTGHICSPC